VINPDKLETAMALIVMEGREMHRAALSLVGGLSDEKALPFLEELLSHEDQEVRIAAIGQLHGRIDLEGLTDVLRRYNDRETYYYNVVVWLDRLIYAREPILSYYKTELERSSKRIEPV
jgi:hypothetical protein